MFSPPNAPKNTIYVRTSTWPRPTILTPLYTLYVSFRTLSESTRRPEKPADGLSKVRVKEGGLRAFGRLCEPSSWQWNQHKVVHEVGTAHLPIQR